jgi:hypothetical protein
MNERTLELSGKPHIHVDFRVEADTPEDAARLLKWAAEKFDNGSAHPITENETGCGKINWEVRSFAPACENCGGVGEEHSPNMGEGMIKCEACNGTGLKGGPAK